MIDVDILIVGAGITGLSAAIEIAGKCNLAIISKAHPLRSNSVNATGGLNAALNPNDRWQDHFNDAVVKSEFLADQDAVELLVKEAPETIIELERMGVLFTRTETGEISQKLLDEQSFPRTCYVKETTGHRILHTLYEHCLKHDLKVFDAMFALKLLIEDNTCKGLIAYDIMSGKLEVFRAKAVLLATGGFCSLYKNTSNSFLNTGDGLALVLNEGLPLKDLEFVQFHPTGIYGHGSLITEHARQGGAYLLNSNNERFMKKFAANKMEQAPTEDIIKAIQTELEKGMGCGDKKDYVLLDITHFGEKRILENFPRTREMALRLLGLDCVKEKIPVQPVANYSIGGIPTNTRCQVLNSESEPVTGLYAAGECSCHSIHGANRLVGNGLLEKIVFGKRCGRTMLNLIKNQRIYPISEQHLLNVQNMLDLLLRKDGNEHPYLIRRELNELMTEKAGIFRNSKDLGKAREKVNELKSRLERLRLVDKSTNYNTELVHAFETTNLLDLASALIECASARNESRGAHYRTDYKKTDNAKWLKHSLIRKTGSELSITYKEPVITLMKPKNGSETENIQV